MLNIPQTRPKFKFTPTQIFLIFLCIYTLIAVIYNFSLDICVLLTAEVAYALLLNFILNLATKKNKTLENTIISTLIFLLVLHYMPTFYGVICTAIGITFLQLYKRFFYYHGNSIFNPTAVGLFFSLLAAYLLQTFLGVNELDLPFVSWWGAYFGGYISMVLIVIWLIIEIKQWHKNFILISFLVVYAIGTLITSGTEFASSSMMSTTIYFFAFIMLVEPRTSPALRNQQLAYGIVAAAVFIGLRYLNVNNFELFALATANLLNFSFRLKPLLLKTN